MTDIKPCPHCGGNAVMQVYIEDATYTTLSAVASYWVECTKCGIRTKRYKTIKEVGKVWNRRVSE